MFASPRELGRKKAEAYTAGAGTDVFSADMTMLHNGLVRVTVCVSAAATMYIRYDGVNWVCFEASPLVADTPRSFSFSMPRGEAFNVRFSANCTIRLLFLEEVDSAVA